MTNRSLILAALLVTAVACRAPAAAPPPEPPTLAGFGLVGCDVISEDGSILRMTINDQDEQMAIHTGSSSMSLPRDAELTDSEIHVAAVHVGERTVAVTLDQNFEMTVTSIAPDKIRIGHGQCTRL